MTDALDRLAAHVGVVSVFKDATGVKRTTPPETKRALLAAMGLAVDTDAATSATLESYETQAAARLLPDYLVVTPKTPVRLAALPGDVPWQLELEIGETLTGQGPNLPKLPLGLHRLQVGPYETTLICAPARLPLPERAWGVTLPLYGLRSAAQGGLGDYGDLAQACEGLATLGAAFVGINPVHAGFPSDPNFFSPYSPSHRRRLNVLHLIDPDETEGQGEDLLDYPASNAHRRADAEQAFARFQAEGLQDGFEAYLTQEGPRLAEFALHQALSDVHGAYWCDWPAAIQDISSPEVADFAAQNPLRIRYHCWLQWRAQEDLGAAAHAALSGGMRFGLYTDLAVGTHPYGAETWAEGPVFARGVSLGAPPDAFSREGQNWGLAPFNPLALRQAAFAPFAETLRCQLKVSRLLRIDHVLGFERTYWVPSSGGLPGAYVAMPRDALMAVTRLEAARVGATVIGEDLGNIPDGLQEAMADSGLLGCRVVQFEQDWDGERAFLPAIGYTQAALAAFGTHDLPTWHGWRNANDIQIRYDLSLIDAATRDAAMMQRRLEREAIDRAIATEFGECAGLLDFIGNCASQLVALQIEDLLGVRMQPNLPGTVDSYPNWRRRLPASAAALAHDASVQDAAQHMSRLDR